MLKVKEINDMIKILEGCILDKEEVPPVEIIGMGLHTEDEYERRGARKALIWAMKTVHKKKEEKPNKKLGEFGINNPITVGADFAKGKDRTIIKTKTGWKNI